MWQLKYKFVYICTTIRQGNIFKSDLKDMIHSR